jgi:cytochrome c-type biogenesis protein CcmH/NrfF
VAEPAPPPTVAGRRLLRLLSPAALAVVIVVTLAVGSGRASAPTLAQRAATVESRIRCPSCADVSVAQSEAPSAIAARQLIVSMLRSGESATAIERSFVNRYGSSILLVPPDSGLGSLVWVLPLAGLVLALCVLAALFVRRQRALLGLRASP